MSSSEISAPTRVGNKAPDWGHQYGIRELWSEVAPGLWVGGTGDDDTVDVARQSIRGRFSLNVMENAEITLKEFDAVVTMYAWARPVDWGVEELRWGIGDSTTGALPYDSLRETVVWAHRRWADGKKVLVRCQAGLNRSSLVAGLVLVRDGLDGDEAVQVIRSGRSREALFNPRFEGIVRCADGFKPASFWRQ